MAWRAAWMARATWVTLAGALLAGSGCYRRPKVGPPGAGGEPRRGESGLQADPVRVYQRMGLLAQGGALPFVGSIGYFAVARPDSTLVAVTLSLPAAALTFQRENDRYRAAYAVRTVLRHGETTVFTAESEEVVRVAGFKETTREDESIVAQRLLAVVPGDYTLAVTVRDVGSARTATAELPLRVPRLAAPALSTPLVVLAAQPRGSLDTLPRIIASPRATVVFGRDSTFDVYLEGYASGTSFPVTLAVRSERGAMLWTQTVALPRRGAIFSDVVRVPVSRIGVGIAALSAAPAGTTDTTRTPLFVSFGENLPVASFEEMLTYLRYFATPAKLDSLKNTTPEARARAWAQFLVETDPNPATPQNEGLRDYFQRVRQANERFRDEGGAGWSTDRGMVYVALGEPDQVYEQGTSDVSQRGRAQIWEYRQHNLQLVFIDQSGFGRWRLTTGSEADFQNTLRRVQESGRQGEK